MDDRVRDVVIFNLKAYSGVNDAKVSDMPAVCDCVFECVCKRERDARIRLKHQGLGSGTICSEAKPGTGRPGMENVRRGG